VPRNAVVSVGYLWGRVRHAYVWDFCGGLARGLRRPRWPRWRCTGPGWAPWYRRRVCDNVLMVFVEVRGVHCVDLHGLASMS
jgi:hypothetical protein